MINALKSLFITQPSESPEDIEHRLHLAVAALLIETARADFTEDAQEEAALESLLCSSLSLPREEVHALVESATTRVDHATSLYEFTRVINDHCSPEQKLQLIETMWGVAYADGNLDKYEEHLIRQVAELTYVPHAEYIRTKLAASPD
ncbi:hypothetical protein CWI75_09400 [Kineobactrum sediminis]|uniref:Co-chaperone DjlA N-terminal domain-containing protein n=1 Tax=Kineobactrum sediminis TaxID=1905677 RepID=A0A2N5Y2Z8_9GAMM|nr:TerB family tellurite resistance protein [Kineobactrum sediminis]PLW82774.1 hypothetical protein CWI75_09400 [Kineobactrum sediminis]